jgi:hypothetical protein
MKARTSFQTASLLMLAAGWFLSGCGDGPSAGTDAGNTDKVAGILTDASGLPAAGRLIQLRPADYQGAAADSLLGHAGSGREWSDTTGADGSFAFTLRPADTGGFVVEALANEVHGARAAFRRKADQAVRLGILSLRPVGGMNGKVRLPDAGFGSVLVTLLGTHQSGYFPGGSGAFAFYTLPPGDYVLRVEGIAPARPPVDTAITVLPGETLADLPLVAGPAADGADGAISLRLTRPGPLAGSLRARLAEGGDILTADSSGSVVFADVPPGTHAVLAWGESPLRDTLRLEGVQVKPGQTAAAGEIRFKIKALIVDGLANHDWIRMTAYNAAILKGTGLFEVAVSTTPPDKAGPAAWAAWNPRFADHDVVILHCNSGYGNSDSANPWPDSIRTRLEDFVSQGGGLVNTHATFPSFAGWPAFEDMHGLKWKFTPDGAPSYRVDSLGGLAPDTATRDSGSKEFTSPGNAGEKMGIANPAHPINNGLPAQWLLPASDLVYRLKGNPQGITVLQYSINPGTGNREPQLWTKAFGKGRVFTDAIGHLLPGMPNTTYRCAGYQTTFGRGVEWAATGKVTLPVPGDFPGPDSLSLRSNPPN